MMTVTAIKDEQGEVLGILVIARDITSMKRKETALEEAKEQAETASKAPRRKSS